MAHEPAHVVGTPRLRAQDRALGPGAVEGMFARGVDHDAGRLHDIVATRWKYQTTEYRMAVASVWPRFHVSGMSGDPS